MTDDQENIILQQILKDIENHLGWVSGLEWSTRDFADLSRNIYEKTGVVLSVTTLKRIWGKVNYKSKPTSATLNALVQYIGYANWQSYLKIKSQKINTEPAEAVGKNIDAKNKNSSKRKVWLIASVVSIISLAFLLNSFFPRPNEKPKQKSADVYSFTSKMMVSEGVPNSVIFEYDATAADPTDTIYIQQSWDKNLRKRVSSKEKIHRSLYYYPGYFQAKLVVNEAVVKEQPLYITTKDWLPLVEQEGSPVYFKVSDALNIPDVLHLSLEKIEANHIPLQPKTPWVSYFNIREFKDINTDDFILETRIRHDYKEGAAACQNSEIHILFEGGAFVIPLSAPGCVSGLMFFDSNGQIKDTSPLGCDLSKWVDIVCSVKNKRGQLYIDGKLAYDNLSLNLPPLKIKGLRFRFQGTGSVELVKLSKDNGEVVYEDDFRKENVN